MIQISFKNKSEAIKIKGIIKNLSSIDSKIYKGKGCYNLCTFSKPLSLIFNKKYEIPIGLKYSKIKVPKIIKRSSEKKKIAFLKGLFDSDGNIYLHRKRKAIQLRQKSQPFLKEVHELFNAIGIKFREPYKDKSNNSWVLWSSKEDLVNKFINKIVNFNIKAS